MKKEIGIGFLTGIIFNAVGIAICVVVIALVKGRTFTDTLDFYLRTDSAWMLISLGALPNLLAFFGFLRINRDYRARGVLIATFLAAILTYLIYFG